MLTSVKISHSFYSSCRLSWFKCARWDPFGEVEKGKDLQVFCLMCVNPVWNKWHKCGLLRDKLDLAEDLALFVHKPINKPELRQRTHCAEPQEGCQGLGSATLTEEPWEGWVHRGSTLVWAVLGGDVLLSCGDPSSSKMWWDEGRLHVPSVHSLISRHFPGS